MNAPRAGHGIRSAYTRAGSTQDIVDDIVTCVGPQADPGVVFVFLNPDADGAKITSLLSQQWPRAEVIGCSTAGEFSDTGTGTGGASALALPTSIVKRAAAEIAGFRKGTASGVQAAIHRIETRLGSRLRELDPGTSIGFLLVDGVHGDEDAVNAWLAHHAPGLSFVGGSAGDDLRFSRTRVYCNGRESDHGAVLLAVELTVPFAILKTCALVPGPRHFTVTRADAPKRVVYEVDGRPVLQAYAEAVGIAPGDLTQEVFMRHPWGLMVDDDPWVRSPQTVLPDGGLRFYCQLPEGIPVTVMQSTDLIEDMREALADVLADLGGRADGAVLFNCILRRLQMDADALHPQWRELIAGLPTAGFHTYGESWLGHMNQTCLGVVFGAEPAGTADRG